MYVGGGIIKSNAEKELLKLAEATGAPVVTTLMALGSFPTSHKQNLGMPGMHGTVAAVTALQKADLLIIGAHGHKGIKDFIFGSTINKVRHRLKIPVFIVRT